MDPYVSHLQDDGSVFPPVTPDPPLPPGQEEIQVPDIVPVSAPDGPDETDTKGEEPTGEPASEPTD